MLVPQWAGRIPKGWMVIWDPELCLGGGAVIQILPKARNSFLELAGGCRVYVLELFYSSVSLHRVIVHDYGYLTRTAEITILELTAT